MSISRRTIPRCLKASPRINHLFTHSRQNLLYTGVIRGKGLVVLIGQRKAIAIAVKGGQTERRWTKLREWLESG
jgi:exodeoxyribonuclease V alpha subunit